MKKLIIILIVLVAAAGAGIYFILPTNINWEKYVQDVSADVKARTGVALNIQGKPVFSMKPSPMLKLGQIRVGNVKDASYPQMMTAVSGEILFDTASLFRRKIKVKKVVLTSPQFYFEVLPNGKWNWQTAFFDKAGANSTIGFDSLLVSGGSAEVKNDKYTPPQKWDRINAEMFADSIQGPFFFEGNFGAISSNFGFSLKVEKYLSGQSPDFSLRLINAVAEASFVFTGKYGLSDTDRGMLTGGLTFDIRKPDQFFALLYPQEKLPAEIFQPIVGNFKINKTAQTRTSKLTDILFQYGTSSATGSLSVRTLSSQEASELQAKEEEIAAEDDFEDEIILRDPNNPAEAVRIDDAPVAQTKVAQNLLPKVVEGSFVFSKLDADPFVSNLSSLLSFLAKREALSKTKDKYSVKLVFDAVNYKGDVIHQLGTQLKSSPEGVIFEKLSATLPSNAYVDGQAVLALTENPLLSGNVSMEASNVSALFGWLKIPLAEEIPQNLMRQFKLEADFKVASGGVVLQKMKGSLDKSDFSGDFAFRNGQRKAISFTTNVSDLNLAEYFPASSKAAIQKREEFSRLTLKNKVHDLFARLAFFNEFDINADLTSQKMAWADINAENLKMDFSVVRGQMKINEISAKKFLASTISLQGELEGFGAEPKFNNFAVNIDAQQLSSLTQAIGVSVPKSLSPQDKMTLSAKLSGSMMMMDFDAFVDFELARFGGKGNFKEIAPDTFDWDAAAVIQHKNFRNFVRLFTSSYKPVLANPGMLDFKGQLIKNKDVFQILNMDARVGENHLTGTVKKRVQSGVPVVEADLAGENLALLGLLPQVNFADSLFVDTTKRMPENVWETDGALTQFAKSLSFSKKPFDFSFLGKYEATIALKTNNFFLNSFVLSDFDGIVKLTADKIVIDVRRALWNNANFGGIFNLIPMKDSLTVRNALRISNIDVPANLFVSSGLNVGKIKKMVLNMNVDGSGKSTDALISSLTGKGTLSFEEAEVDGIYVKQFLVDLKKLPDLSKKKLETIALDGRTEISRFSSEINIKDGTLTLRPGSFFYNGNKNETPFFTYNYLARILSAGVSFPTGIPSVPDISLSIEKTDDQPAVLSQNITGVIDAYIAFGEEQKKQAQEKELQQRKKEEEAQAKIRNMRLERLNRIDEKLTLASADLSKKLSVLRPLSEKVYQLHKHLVVLNDAEKALIALSDAVQKAKADPKSDEEINALEDKLKADYFDKEKEIDSSYNVAMIVGLRGSIFDVSNQANELLRSEMKALSAHEDLLEIEKNVNEIKALIITIKEKQTRSETDGLTPEDLTILLGEVEADFDKIKGLHQKTLDLIEQKKVRMAQEEKAKKEAEERKKKEEEEAKKAAEAAAAAEKAKQEAEIRERQRTIVRKDGIRDTSNAKVLKTGKSASATLQAIATEKTEAAATDESKTEEKKENSIVIRRR